MWWQGCDHGDGGCDVGDDDGFVCDLCGFCAVCVMCVLCYVMCYDMYAMNM
jgi:hypothetical protein